MSLFIRSFITLSSLNTYKVNIIMKKTDYIFWIALGIIALFYLLKGNSMHDEKYKIIQEQAQVQSSN